MSEVRLIEVAARDGLQNEKVVVPTAVKLELIERLAGARLRDIEATSFVSKRWVPALADHEELMRALRRRPGVRYPVLVPNLRGYEAALSAGARELAIFASASEAFSRKNINCSIDESFARFEPLMEAARREGLWVRGYVSCVVGCPYEGSVAPENVADVAARLLALGCTEVSLGDTIGIGTPASVKRMLEVVAAKVALEKVAGHFHDTYGRGLANVLAAWEFGVRAFDSSVGGLGGCPYAKNATGNVATEDLVYLFERRGVSTGANLEALIETATWITAKLGRGVQSSVGRVFATRH